MGRYYPLYTVSYDNSAAQSPAREAAETPAAAAPPENQSLGIPAQLVELLEERQSAFTAWAEHLDEITLRLREQLESEDVEQGAPGVPVESIDGLISLQGMIGQKREKLPTLYLKLINGLDNGTYWTSWEPPAATELGRYSQHVASAVANIDDPLLRQRTHYLSEVVNQWLMDLESIEIMTEFSCQKIESKITEVRQEIERHPDLGGSIYGTLEELETAGSSHPTPNDDELWGAALRIIDPNNA